MENKLKGGKADKMTPEDIANKFGVTTKTVKDQINKGKKIESEHTDDKEKQTEIASDHVAEFPDYYDRIEKMEKEAEKHWNKKEKTNESKLLVKKLLRENLENTSIQQQIAQQLEKMGVEPNNADVLINHKRTSYEPIESMDEGALSTAGKVLISCVIGASSLVSCKKAENEFMYKYSYQDARQLNSKDPHVKEMKATCFFKYDHILSPAEIEAEENRIEHEFETENNIDVVDGTDKLEFEEKNNGQWG